MRKRDKRITTEKEVIGNGKRKAKDPPNSVKYEKYGWFDTFFKRKRLESQARVAFAFLFFSTFKDGIGGMTEIRNLGMAGNLGWADQSYSLPTILLLSFRVQDTL